MNEKLQYASMLEIPVSTCSVSAVKGKKKSFFKRKKVNAEQVKEQLLKKVNNEQEQEQVLPLLSSEQAQENIEQTDLTLQEQSPCEVQAQLETEQASASVYPVSAKKRKKGLKFSIVGVQMVIIGVLVATIFLTNAIYADSGINVFLRNVFGTQTITVDNREFNDFVPTLAMGDNQGLTMENGVITFGGEGSIYAPCDGKVSQVIKGENDTYDLIIAHSDNFNSVITGIEHLYVQEGDKVYSNIPLGYLKPNGATISFTDQEGKILVDYQIVDNTVVWQV